MPKRFYTDDVESQGSRRVDGTDDASAANVSAMAAREPTGTADVAERLRLSREALKLTQAALCRITGISTAAWNNAETADARIGIDNAVLLCQATGLTLDWIYRGVRGGLSGEFLEAINRLEAKLPRHKSR